MPPHIEVEAAAAAAAGRLSVSFGSSSTSCLKLRLSQHGCLCLAAAPFAASELSLHSINWRKSDPYRWCCKMSIFQRNPSPFLPLSPCLKTELIGPAARTPHPATPHKADLPLICNSNIQQMAFKWPHLSDTWQAPEAQHGPGQEGQSFPHHRTQLHWEGLHSFSLLVDEMPAVVSLL